ncbi:hypothetical protein [Kocuria oceani]|uniref:YbjN domain-containing protein n=1 Tax=Kocuria oceani TaxID=988827 RepID=A0ABV9TIY9_9MICC|nr:hypothetical protein [Kocuria oceani]
MTTHEDLTERAERLYDLLSADLDTLHLMGTSAPTGNALTRLAAVLGDTAPLYVWPTDVSDATRDESGKLHVLTASTVLTTEYGERRPLDVQIMRLNLTALNVVPHISDGARRLRSGIIRLKVELGRGPGWTPITLEARGGQDSRAVDALLHAVHVLSATLD